MYDFVISPEPFIQKCKSLAKAKNPYLEVLDGRVRLAWRISSDDDRIDFSLMNLSGKDLEISTADQLTEIRSEYIEEAGKIIHNHLENLGSEEINESDNENLAKFIARRLIRQMEVSKPQAVNWLLALYGLIPEQWEYVLLSMTIPISGKDSKNFLLYYGYGSYNFC